MLQLPLPLYFPLSPSLIPLILSLWSFPTQTILFGKVRSSHSCLAKISSVLLMDLILASHKLFLHPPTLKNPLTSHLHLSWFRTSHRGSKLIKVWLVSFVLLSLNPFLLKWLVIQLPKTFGTTCAKIFQSNLLPMRCSSSLNFPPSPKAPKPLLPTFLMPKFLLIS